MVERAIKMGTIEHARLWDSCAAQMGNREQVPAGSHNDNTRHTRLGIVGVREARDKPVGDDVITYK